MLRVPIVVLALAACGSSPPAGTGGSGGAGGSDPCAEVDVRFLGGGRSYTKPLHDGDTVQWQLGPNGGYWIWTGFLLHGFSDQAPLLITLRVLSPDGTDRSEDLSWCIPPYDLTSTDGWRSKACFKDAFDWGRWGAPVAGPVKLRITVRDEVKYDTSNTVPCAVLDVPHCEATAEVSVFARAPVDNLPPMGCPAP